MNLRTDSIRCTFLKSLKHSLHTIPEDCREGLKELDTLLGKRLNWNQDILTKLGIKEGCVVMHCHNCDDELSDDQVRWAFEEPYCEDCFDNMFNYCCRCDGVIYRESAHYNDEGDPYCSDCYEDNFDDDAPTILMSLILIVNLL